MMLATLIYSLVIALAVLVHFEVLSNLTRWLPRLPVTRRVSVLFGVFGALIAHVVEVWLFGIAYYLMLKTDYFGGLTGNFTNSLLDCVYFSFTCYSSLGFGDINPFGLLRFLTGLEALTGLLLIAWTASFMYIEMQKFWKQ